MASDCGIYVPTDLEMPVKIFTILHGMNSSWEVQDKSENSGGPDSTRLTGDIPYSFQENVSKSVPGASIGQNALGTAIGLSLGDSLMKSTEGHYLFVFNPPPKEIHIRKHFAQ
jgi:hypothetical protein